MKILFVIIFIVCFCGFVSAAEYQFQDVTASVVVGSTFKFSVDKESIDFGLITPGKEIILYPDRHYTQVNCISNNGKTWYLKMQAQGELKNARGGVIPVENFKWQVYSTNGSGIKPEGWQNFKKDAPVLVYTSGSGDNYGNDVDIQIRFALDAPANVSSGNYSTSVIYSMTESP